MKDKAMAFLSVRKISQIWPQRLFCRKYRIAVRSLAPEEMGWDKSGENKTQMTQRSKGQNWESGIMGSMSRSHGNNEQHKATDEFILTPIWR